VGDRRQAASHLHLHHPACWAGGRREAYRAGLLIAGSRTSRISAWWRWWTHARTLAPCTARRTHRVGRPLVGICRHITADIRRSKAVRQIPFRQAGLERIDSARVDLCLLWHPQHSTAHTLPHRTRVDVDIAATESPRRGVTGRMERTHSGVASARDCKTSFSTARWYAGRLPNSDDGVAAVDCQPHTGALCRRFRSLWRSFSCLPPLQLPSALAFSRLPLLPHTSTRRLKLRTTKRHALPHLCLDGGALNKTTDAYAEGFAEA